MSAPDATPSASDGRGTGREVQDDIAAAQQYVLDLQVLFYSLKTVASSSKEDAVAKAVQAATQSAATTTPTVTAATQTVVGEGHKNASPGTFDVVTTTLLHQQLDELTEQLAVERHERTKLQEQLNKALSMLRKSYGQIVDDYLFATEQLHERTRQLENLLETSAPAVRPMLLETASLPLGFAQFGSAPGRPTYPDASDRDEADRRGSKVSISRSASDRGIMPPAAGKEGAEGIKCGRATSGGSGNCVPHDASQAPAVHRVTPGQGQYGVEGDRLSRHQIGGGAAARTPLISSVAAPGPVSTAGTVPKVHANKADAGIGLHAFSPPMRWNTRQPDSDVSGLHQAKAHSATAGTVVAPSWATPIPMSGAVQTGTAAEGIPTKRQGKEGNPVHEADEESAPREPRLQPHTLQHQRSAAPGLRLRDWGEETRSLAAGLRRATQWALESPPAAGSQSPVEPVSEGNSEASTPSRKFSEPTASAGSAFASNADRAAVAAGISTWQQLPDAVADQPATPAAASDHIDLSRNVLQDLETHPQGAREALSDVTVPSVGSVSYGGQYDGAWTTRGWFADEARAFLNGGPRHVNERDDMEALSGAAAALEAATRSAQAAAQAAAAKASAIAADLTTHRQRSASLRSEGQTAEAAAGMDAGTKGTGCEAGKDPSGPLQDATERRVHDAGTTHVQQRGLATDDADIIHSSKRLRRASGSPAERGNPSQPGVDDTPSQNEQSTVKGPAGGDTAAMHASRHGSRPTPPTDLPAINMDRTMPRPEQPRVSSSGATVGGRSLRYVQSVPVPAPQVDVKLPISKPRLSERIVIRSAPGTADIAPLQSGSGGTNLVPSESAAAYPSVAEPRVRTAGTANAVAAGAAATNRPPPTGTAAAPATQGLAAAVGTASGADGTASGTNTWLRSTRRLSPVSSTGHVDVEEGHISSHLNSQHRGVGDRMDSSRSTDSTSALDALLRNPHSGGDPEDSVGSPHATSSVEGCNGAMPATSAIAAMFAANDGQGPGSDIGAGIPASTFSDLASLVLGLRQWATDPEQDGTALERDLEAGGWDTNDDDDTDADGSAAELGGYDSIVGANGVDDDDLSSFSGSDVARLDLRKVDLHDLGLSGKGSTEETALDSSPPFSMYDHEQYVAADSSTSTSPRPRYSDVGADPRRTISAAAVAGSGHSPISPSGNSGGVTIPTAAAAAASIDVRTLYNPDDRLQAEYEARTVLASFLNVTQTSYLGSHSTTSERHSASEASRPTVAPAASVLAPAAARATGASTQATPAEPAPPGSVGWAAGGQHDRIPLTDQTSPRKASHGASRWKMTWDEGHAGAASSDAAAASGNSETGGGFTDWRGSAGGGLAGGEGVGLGRARGDVGQGRADSDAAGELPTDVIVARLARELENLRSTFALGLKRRVSRGTAAATAGPESDGGGLGGGQEEGFEILDEDAVGAGRTSVAGVSVGSGPSYRSGEGDLSWRWSDVALRVKGEAESRPWQPNASAGVGDSIAGWRIGLGGSAGVGGMSSQAGSEGRSASRTSTKAHGIVLQGEGC